MQGAGRGKTCTLAWHVLVTTQPFTVCVYHACIAKRKLQDDQSTTTPTSVAALLDCARAERRDARPFPLPLLSTLPRGAGRAGQVQQEQGRLASISRSANSLSSSLLSSLSLFASFLQSPARLAAERSRGLGGRVSAGQWKRAVRHRSRHLHRWSHIGRSI